ncbi:hypothetical protein LXG23DRAFT_50885 [Yarrowia lipolytica]|uniref:F-box domain-containing protein n=1 Tax=Yarrowia lipolytica TaxID=4952 RepID=A0A1D8N3F0_YARLL|nr:hypothetical protein YALI1_A02426g [Yarrowia lipolytica]KAB8284271.1 hypothetical protein BKA91DRAFT_110155 [Yarrowia lipolytica]KAE8169881.1 hypothetical protein BKA90DRAFT_117413 [Yarrowia lipolytica]KAJ8051285.1 hypothetical protein LXG23DRAFT_50885 [Yarrowia lipolytica]RMI96947.1 hypothetical protein BD777DRAFT_142045 [Yarrowia lipolytica]
MDTREECDRQWDDLRQSIESEWLKRMETGHKLYLQFFQFHDFVKDEHGEIQMSGVPVAASKEQVGAAVDDLARECAAIMERLTPAHGSLVLNQQRQMEYVRGFRNLVRPKEYEGAQQQYLIGILLGLSEKCLVWEGLMKEFEQTWESLESVMFQGGLQNIVRNQSEELKNWFFQKYQSKFGEHISPVTSTKPQVVLKDIASRPTETRFLPPEIMTMIYARVDLETCVAIRQVSSKWYTIFQQSDSILRTKLRQRNPWMKPGDGEMKTWQDCALLLVGRLKSDKWHTTDNIDTIKVTKPNAPRKTMVSLELFEDENLPSDFTSILDDCGCGISTCEHVHIDNDQARLVVDPWTMESRRYEEPYEVVSVGETISTLRFRDIVITLPTWLIDDEDCIEDIYIGRTMVSVYMVTDHVLMFPRDLAHHQDYFWYTRQDSHYHFGNMYVSREGFYFNLADLEGRKMVRYAKALRARPQAFYNGLVWWTVGDTSLVPTFIDLETPEKVYYNADGAITGFSKKNVFAQGSDTRDSSHLVATEHKYGQEIVDLATGIITLVKTQMAWPEPSVHFLGYRDGKFQSWCMCSGVVDYTRRKASAQLGI